MLKRYTFWFTAAVLFQFVNGIIHTISLFITPSGDNDVEKQMFSLMTTYKIDLGLGFHPTFFNLFTALSSCLSFLCFYSALTNGYLLLKHTDDTVMRGIIGINLAIFGMLLVVMACFTFIFPVACVGLIFINLLAAFVLVPKSD